MKKIFASVGLALLGLCAATQVVIAGIGAPASAKKLPEGEYAIWEEGVATGEDLTSDGGGNNVSTEGPPPWFGQWDDSTDSYDQHPGAEDLHVFPTAAPGLYTFELKDGSGNIIRTGSLYDSP